VRRFPFVHEWKSCQQLHQTRGLCFGEPLKLGWLNHMVDGGSWRCCKTHQICLAFVFSDSGSDCARDACPLQQELVGATHRPTGPGSHPLSASRRSSLPDCDSCVLSVKAEIVSCGFLEGKHALDGGLWFLPMLLSSSSDEIVCVWTLLTHGGLSFLSFVGWLFSAFLESNQ
jgi:hypothetical protein